MIGYRDLDRIGATLAPIMLRRRKDEVLSQLPERVDNDFFVPLTEAQRVHHEENGETVRRIVQRWRRTGFLSDADQRLLTCALQNMRMSCNSTYLLDGETDHGTKIDELEMLLEEMFAQPDAKAVVFSQWVRTHELIIRRLEARGWGYVLFHGGVPGDQRPALVDRFHEDPACRVFLSTDAGGVGLNLQHAAAAVVNMDLPWNPAVLEQRIGRVHRMGQRRSVQVVNFVAQGSIEEGMLAVLAFKKSLFAGVLDGGASEVFLHGTRLSKFMETVDEVTGAMGTAEAAAAPEQAREEAPAPAASEAVRPTAEVSPAADPWAPLVDAGHGEHRVRGHSCPSCAGPSLSAPPAHHCCSVWEIRSTAWLTDRFPSTARATADGPWHATRRRDRRHSRSPTGAACCARPGSRYGSPAARWSPARRRPGCAQAARSPPCRATSAV